jgi:hypothetical protein
VSRVRATPAGTRQRHALGGSENGPLTLIHRTKSPKPIGMRVSGRFAPFLLRPLREVLYLPVSAVPYLPGGPLRWLWLVRFVVTIDTPLRRAIHGRALHARTQ